jgi:hypothetical protein
MTPVIHRAHHDLSARETVAAWLGIPVEQIWPHHAQAHAKAAAHGFAARCDPKMQGIRDSIDADISLRLPVVACLFALSQIESTARRAPHPRCRAALSPDDASGADR